jgi:multidrug transporter EmrE-like cation transporter
MEEKDHVLWRIAQKRANFQRSLVTYVVVMGLLWFVWWFTIGRKGINTDMPWPVWAMIGWGIGLVFQYIGAYGSSKTDLAEREYERLKQKERR